MNRGGFVFLGVWGDKGLGFRVQALELRLHAQPVLFTGALVLSLQEATATWRYPRLQ